jgi:photosystem II stability/assembly factor-like uncharacterized protein
MERQHSNHTLEATPKIASSSVAGARTMSVAILGSILASVSLLATEAQAQFEKTDWRALETNTHVEFTGASIFSMATTLFVDEKGFLWDTWDTLLVPKPHHLDVINSRREPIEAVRFTDVEYNTDSSGFICGEQGILLQSKDWGRNWKQRYFENLDLLYFYDMEFVNSRQGVLVGVTGNDSIRYKGIVYRTDDGGDTWQEVKDVKGIGFSHVHQDLENNKLIITAIGSVLISDDRGKTWESVILPEGDIMRTAILTGEHGVAVGMNGRILRSEDGGENWKDAESPTESNLISIDRFAPGQWFIVGDHGEVWSTKDFGKTWKNISIKKDVRLNGVKRMGPKLFVWGADGTIMVRGLGRGHSQ